MGNIEQIDELETYIKDLGEEIIKVKKASDYLRLIEDFQDEIKKTSATLILSNDNLVLIQKIVDSKLELFQSTTQNIESKQQVLEQSLQRIQASLEDSKLRLDRSEKGIISSFKEINKILNQNHDSLNVQLTHNNEENRSFLVGMSRINKIFLIINSVLSVSILGTLVYLLAKI